MSVDPKSNWYPDKTPYNFSGNNPINIIDPNGMWEEDPDGNWVAQKGDGWWGLHVKSGMSWKDTKAFAKAYNAQRGRDNWKSVRVGDQVTLPGSENSSGSTKPSEPTQSIQASSTPPSQSNEPKHQYEKGNVYEFSIRYKEPISFGIGHGGASYSTVTISKGEETIKSSGMSGSWGGGASLFHQSKGDKIHFYVTLSGDNILEVFNSTTRITTKSAGGCVIFDLIRGFDSNGNLLWSAQLRGSAFGGKVGGSQGGASFE